MLFSIHPWLDSLLSSDGFPPRWLCGQWSPVLGWTQIISDLFIWAAYFVIPFLLWRIAKQRTDTPFRGVFYLFSLFIFSCGLTHLVEVVIFWEPIYRLSAAIKVITAVVSMATVVALSKAVPKVLQYKSIKEMNAIIDSRTAELTQSVDRSAQLAAFTRLANRIAEHGYENNDFSKTLFFAVSSLKSMLKWDIGHSYLLDTTQNAYISTEHWECTQPDDPGVDELMHLSDRIPIPVGQGLVGLTASLKCIRWVEKIAYDTPFVLGERLEPAEIVSFLGMPIHINGQTVAVIEFLSPVQISVDEDVLEHLKLIQTSLMRFKERLDVNQQRQSTIATLTHDMKTPLKSEIYLCQKLLDGRYGELPEQSRELIQDLGHSSAFMLNMIENVLTNFQYGEQAVPITPEWIDLTATVQRICTNEIAVLAEERGHTLHIDIPDHSVQARADEQAVRRILFNLLQNAIDYTHQGGHISVSMVATASLVTIRIQDSGEGIPLEQRSFLFNPSLSRAGKRPRYRGTGLGLQVCKQLTEAHLGAITYSDADGRFGCTGACFTVVLPIQSNPSSPSLYSKPDAPSLEQSCTIESAPMSSTEPY